MWLIFFIITFISLEIGCVADSCRHGWILHGNSCYLFAKDESETWPESAGMCKALGSHLVEIQSAEEDHFILDRLRNVIRNGHSYWIGGNDVATERYWVWAESGHHIEYYNWAPGQPSGHREANCMSLWSDASYLWDETGCTAKRYSFICETELEAQLVG